jgi:hypothetical protein
MRARSRASSIITGMVRRRNCVDSLLPSGEQRATPQYDGYWRGNPDERESPAYDHSGAARGRCLSLINRT